MDDDAAKFFERAVRAFVGDRADVSLANREGGDTTGGFLADAFGGAARAFAEELTGVTDIRYVRDCQFVCCDVVLVLEGLASLPILVRPSSFFPDLPVVVLHPFI